MRFYVLNFKWIMLISGLLTCSMFSGLFFPEASLLSNFGEYLTPNSENIIVRNWSALIGLMGIMLIYGAFQPSVRNFVLVIAGISKIIFITLVLTLGKQYMSFGAGTAVVVDSIMLLFFILYLIFSRLTKTA